MAKYLVTGGCGFIGSHLTEKLLSLGADVIVLDNLSTGRRDNLPKDATFIHGDICDASLVQSIISQVDGCFHLAAIASVEQSNQQWVKTHKTNLTGTINIFDAARPDKLGRQIPIIYASSAAVYGNNTCIPLGEKITPNPITAYGADKYGCELHAAIGYQVHHIPSIGWRFFNVYGPRQDPNSPYSGVISIFFEKIIKKQPIDIHGNGEQSRDFIFVDDIIQYLIKSIQQYTDTAQVFNACTGLSTTINQLAITIQDILTTNVQINYTSTRKGDISKSLGDPELSKSVLNFKANTSLRKGLKMLAQFYKVR